MNLKWQVMARRKVEINLNGLEKKKKPKFTYDPDNDPFILRNAKERMDAAKDMEIPNMLMGELIYERTIIMLFSETGLGKSLLAYQFGDAVSRGKSILGLENNTKPQNVLLVDFENGEMVYKKRYNEVTKQNGKESYFNEYPFAFNNFHMCDLEDPDKYQVPKTNTIEWWFEYIKYKAEVSNSKIVIIDNLFALISQGGIESTKEVAPLIKELHKLKRSKGWTVILIHHTPKRGNDPLTRNDLAGSSNLSNLVDGVIGIGKSVYDGDEHSRYIKQIKPTRFSASVYGETNVITCKTARIFPNFTGFELISLGEDEMSYKNESTHLKARENNLGKRYTQDERLDNIKRMLDLEKANPDITKKQIADYLGVERRTVYNYKDFIAENPQLFDNYGK